MFELRFVDLNLKILQYMYIFKPVSSLRPFPLLLCGLRSHLKPFFRRNCISLKIVQESRRAGNITKYGGDLVSRIFCDYFHVLRSVMVGFKKKFHGSFFFHTSKEFKTDGRGRKICVNKSRDHNRYINKN